MSVCHPIRLQAHKDRGGILIRIGSLADLVLQLIHGKCKLANSHTDKHTHTEAKL